MRIVLLLLLAVSSPAFAQEEATAFLITNVSVFDGKNEELVEGANVLVQGNLISSISSEALDVGDATVIDGNGGTLMPGMIDNHWHVTYAEIPTNILATGDVLEVAIRGMLSAEDTLLRGFTTVRDLGGNPFSIKKMIDDNEISGPRIYPSGPPISQTSGHFDFRDKNAVPVSPGDPLGYWERNAVLMTADGVPDVIRRVRENLRMGATQIKLAAGGGTSSQFDPLDVQQFTLDEMKAAVEVAETWNTYVTVHAYTPAAVQTAIDAGVQVIEHGQLLDDATMQVLAENDIWLSLQPFVVEDDAQYADDPVVRAKQQRMVQGTATAYELAKKYDVQVAWGTDILFSLGAADAQSYMVTLLVKYFDFTPFETLKMVTHDNAQLLKLSGERNPYPGELGVVAEGAYADLIIVDGNPLENISLIADPAANFTLIMKDGIVVKNQLQN